MHTATVVIPLMKVLELDVEKCGLDAIEPTVASEPTVCDGARHRSSMVRELTRPAIDLGVIGAYRPTIAQGPEVLARVEAECCDIAERADVSQRTLFRHFPTKEALLYGDMDDARLQLRDSLSNRPANEPILKTVRESMLSLAADFERNRERRLLQARLAATSPSSKALTSTTSASRRSKPAGTSWSKSETPFRGLV